MNVINYQQMQFRHVHLQKIKFTILLIYKFIFLPAACSQAITRKACALLIVKPVKKVSAKTWRFVTRFTSQSSYFYGEHHWPNSTNAEKTDLQPTLLLPTCYLS